MPLAREIYQEGLRIPPVLLMRGGKAQRDVMELILANVRTPEEREGDLLAQVMAGRRGEERLREAWDPASERISGNDLPAAVPLIR